MRYSDSGRDKSAAGTRHLSTGSTGDRSIRAKPLEVLTKDSESMKLIPWEDIWTSLRVAQIRGNGEMIDVFYDTLFKEAIFDDDGAWALNSKKRS
jgi:hypothetical protein